MPVRASRSSPCAAIDDVDADPDLTVDVIGFQWQWQFDYPASASRVIGTDDEQPELVLPATSKVRFDLTSIDVIHSFWIPGFRFKRDMFPGQTQTFQVDVGDRTGVPEHRRVRRVLRARPRQMRFSVRIVTPDEFQPWAPGAPAP